MKTIIRLIMLILLITGWGLAALSLHVVRAPGAGGSDAFALVPKDRLGISETYVDTRKWSADDVAKHPAVVSRLLATGKADLLQHVGDERAIQNIVAHSPAHAALAAAGHGAAQSSITVTIPF